MTVRDSSAVLAYLNAEPGHERVVEELDGGSISAVNWTEVCQKIAAYTGTTDLAYGLLALGLDVRPFSSTDAQLAAALYPDTHGAGLSLADRACLGLALVLDETAVTADRAWRAVQIDVPIDVIRH